MTVLSIGSIIKVNNYKLCIVGYTTAENSIEEKSGYLVVSYPVGFTKLEKVFFIPFESEFDVIAEGYKTKDTEKFMEVMADGLKLVEKIPYETLEKLQKVVKDALSKREAMNDE